MTVQHVFREESAPTATHLLGGERAVSGYVLKFPHIKFNEKKRFTNGPLPTHNKQAGKRIFTTPEE